MFAGGCPKGHRCVAFIASPEIAADLAIFGGAATDVLVVRAESQQEFGAIVLALLQAQNFEDSLMVRIVRPFEHRLLGLLGSSLNSSLGFGLLLDCFFSYRGIADIVRLRRFLLRFRLLLFRVRLAFPGYTFLRGGGSLGVVGFEYFLIREGFLLIFK